MNGKGKTSSRAEVSDQLTYWDLWHDIFLFVFEMCCGSFCLWLEPCQGSDMFPACSSSEDGDSDCSLEDIHLDKLFFTAMQKKLRLFLSEHPCPSRANVESWVETIFGSTEPSEPFLDLRDFLLGLDCGLEMFDYAALEMMWKAGGQDGEKQMLREVGEALDQKGGMACMRLHYYLLDFALLDSFFVEGDLPKAVKQYLRDIEVAWDGIGLWKF